MTKKVIIVVTILLLVAFGIGLNWSGTDREPAFDSGTLHCVLDIDAYDKNTDGLITGYNYFLLKRFAEDNGMDADIRMSDTTETLTYLPEDVDILVIPCNGASVPDSAVLSKPLDNMTCWVSSPVPSRKMKRINEWISDYEKSAERIHLYDLFTNVYEPFVLAKKGERRRELGPYDSMIRENAATLGWDWKLLAAVVFQESRFRINARSHTGAFGLMQVVSRTAGALEVDNLLDPEQNIKAGTRYLMKLQKMFRKYASSPSDLQRFTLVAYNIGENKLKELIDSSIQAGEECSTWEQLERLLPSEDISIYIQKIFNYYWAFSRIYIEMPVQEEITQSVQTVQDQPLQ